MNHLFINACVRDESRTLMLARYFLGKIPGRISEVNLQKEDIKPLDRERLAKREQLIRDGMFEHPMFDYARQFASADVIVIAAPYWDLSFPAVFKIYLEAVNVPGITFCYANGIPKGLCRAKKLIYITTAGGGIFADFGYSYVKMLSETFYGIEETVCFQAENLDVDGVDILAELKQEKQAIDRYLLDLQS